MWINILIETMFMRYGKEPTGFTCLTAKPWAVQIWAENLHTCNTVLKDFGDFKEKEEPIKTYH